MELLRTLGGVRVDRGGTDCCANAATALEACAPGGGDFIRTIRGGGYLFGATVGARA